jgi:hypothetical protein
MSPVYLTSITYVASAPLLGYVAILRAYILDGFRKAHYRIWKLPQFGQKLRAYDNGFVA